MRIWSGVRYGAVVFVLLMLSGSGVPSAMTGVRAESRTPAAQSGEWPTTEFKVLQRRLYPDPLPVDPDARPQMLLETFVEWAIDMMDEEAAAQQSMADAAWIRLIEGFLHEAAVQYEQAGFKAPRLQKVHDLSDGGRTKYVVYLTDFSTVPLLLALGQKHARGVTHVLGTLLINKPQFVPSQQELSDSAGGEYRAAPLYHTLSHELFHAIQNAHFLDTGRLMVPLGPAKAVVEGSADGAAMYLTNARFPGYLETQNAGQFESGDDAQAWVQREQLGGYPYYLGFLLEQSNPELANPYWTSSFWFHITERFGGLSVLRDLFQQTWPTAASGEDLLRWLDGGLKKHERLYSAFAHFAAELTSYGGRRYQTVDEGTWQEWVVGHCSNKGMSLTPENETVLHRFQFVSKLSGNCVKVDWNGFQENAALKVEVRHPVKEVVDQINLGLVGSTYSGGSCWNFVSGDRSRSCVQERVGGLEQSAEGWWARTWQLPPRGYGAAGDGIFAVSNAAFDPWETQAADGLEIRFSFQRTEDQTGVQRAPPAGMHLKIGMPNVPSRGDLRPHDPDPAGGPQYLLISNRSGGQNPAPEGDRPSYWQYRTYGINPDPPAQQSIGASLLPMAPIVIPKGDGPDAIERARYIVTPSPSHPLPLGQTGPLHGFVLYDEPPESDSPGRLVPVGKIGSVFCPDAEAPIGRVLVNTADLLKVHVQTDICTFKLLSRNPVVVERLDLIAVLPFGWRYQEPAPTVAVTAGIDYYVKRFFDRVEGRIEGAWPFGNPKPDITPADGSGETASGSTAGNPGSSTVNVQPPPCDCSCEGFKTFEELSKRKRNPESEAEMKAFMPCVKQCMVQWAPCARR